MSLLHLPLGATSTPELTGLVGWIISVIDAFGAGGVALMVALENVFPPIPSEVVLPFAGFSLGQRGGGLLTMVLAATAGSVVGAVVLYETGRGFGLVRTRRALAALPLVDTDDVDRSIEWFRRHGTMSVLLGRCVPLVRSLVSLPAGADGMPRGRFVLLTTVGSAVWNATWVSAGYVLGDRWERAAAFSDVLNTVLLVVVSAIVLRLGWRALRRRRGG